MKKVAVVYHSGYGHTERQAKAVAEGAAAVEGVMAHLISVADVDRRWEDLAAADAIVFGAPTYMGSVSGDFKKFMDASSKAWFGSAWKDKLAAGFTNSATMNGDKHSTLHYMITLAMQHSGLWVGTGMMPSNSKAATRNDINFVGSSGGLMTSTPSDAGVDEMVPGDIATAKAFGQRLAEVTQRIGA
jgi:multimeric flavodoxin WrbA